MFCFLRLCFGMLDRLFRGRQSLLLENLNLRQQLLTLKRLHPRPSLGPFDKLFWVIARRVWSAWKQSLIIVTPKTVVRWDRTGFRMYWRLISRVRRQVGRMPTPMEVRELIFRMVVESPTWEAPRVHGELRMLGFELSERTISRWMGHDRRRILHVNVTKHPTSGWIIQQLREAFPFKGSHKYEILDRDQKFGLEVIAAVQTTSTFPSELPSGVHGRMGSRSGGWEAADETCWTTLLR